MRRGEADGERRERQAVYDGWWRCETLEDVEEQKRLVDRYAERHPGMVDRSDAEIARERLKMMRKSIERHREPWSAGGGGLGGPGEPRKRPRSSAESPGQPRFLHEVVSAHHR